MDRPNLAWKVLREGDTVRVVVMEAGEITGPDADALAASVERGLSEDGVSIMQLDGPVLDDRPEGLAYVLLKLQKLAERHGTQLVVSPI